MIVKFKAFLRHLKSGRRKNILRIIRNHSRIVEQYGKEVYERVLFENNGNPTEEYIASRYLRRYSSYKVYYGIRGDTEKLLYHALYFRSTFDITIIISKNEISVNYLCFFKSLDPNKL